MENKVVLITGSTSGIGAETAKLFASKGARVVVTGRNQANLDKVVNECNNVSPSGQKALGVIADVMDDKALKDLLEKTIEHFGQLDVLVNNVGFSKPAKVLSSEFPQVFDQIINGNLRSVALLTHLAAPHLIKSKGNIVNISSVAAVRPSATNTAYSTAKAGLDMFSKCVAVELAPDVRVNTINPGYIRTNFLENMGLSGEVRQSADSLMANAALLEKAGKPEDIAKAILYLASDDANFVTGANWVIDGGIVLAASKQHPLNKKE